MTVYEGSIITCDERGSVARFLVEDRGRIEYVGDKLPERYASLPRTGLGDGSLVPALADTHIHFMSYALFASGLDVRNCRSIEETAARIAEFAKARRDAVIVGFGASAHAVAEKRLPTRADLDRSCSDRGVFVVKYDGHACTVNSPLLASLPKSLASVRGYNAESGIMTQEAFFRVTDFVTSKVSLIKTLDSMLSAIDGMAAWGIGTVHSVTGVGFPMDADVMLESAFARGLRNPMRYRIFFQTMDVEKVIKRRLPRIGGCFSTALDGCFGSVDAALNSPYSNDRGNAGILYYPDETVRDFAVRANRAGLQIEMHAIGDRAFDQAVGAIRAALEDFPRSDHRHTVIHACLPTERGLETCAELDIGIAVQPAFLRWDQEPLGYLEGILGNRALSLSPLKRMAGMGIRMAGGSDAPCTAPDPIRGIWAACNHYLSGESLSIQEALNLYTRNAAWMGFDEKECGSLEIGKAADMTVLSADPLATDPKRLLDLRVEKLILAGNAYKPGQGKTEMLARALFSRREI